MQSKHNYVCLIICYILNNQKTTCFDQQWPSSGFPLEAVKIVLHFALSAEIWLVLTKTVGLYWDTTTYNLVHITLSYAIHPRSVHIN